MTDTDGEYTTYEERITLWQASSADEAIARAEEEAVEYAAGIEETPVTYLGLAQCFHLFDVPEDGAEIFSLMRDSDLDHDDYIDSFFDTGAERASDVDDLGDDLGDDDEFELVDD